MIEQYDPLEGEMLQILNERGEVKGSLEPKLSDEELKKIYTFMVTARTADLRAFKLLRQGRMGTYAPSL